MMRNNPFPSIQRGTLTLSDGDKAEGFSFGAENIGEKVSIIYSIIWIFFIRPYVFYRALEKAK